MNMACPTVFRLILLILSYYFEKGKILFLFVRCIRLPFVQTLDLSDHQGRYLPLVDQILIINSECLTHLISLLHYTQLLVFSVHQSGRTE